MSSSNKQRTVRNIVNKWIANLPSKLLNSWNLCSFFASYELLLLCQPFWIFWTRGHGSYTRDLWCYVRRTELDQYGGSYWGKGLPIFFIIFSRTICSVVVFTTFSCNLILVVQSLEGSPPHSCNFIICRAKMKI